MRIALAQLNYHIASFKENCEKIIQSIHKAKNLHAELVVFSELSVCGYPPQDLLEQKDFIIECENQIKIIASHCIDIAAIVGAPSINPDEKGKKLFNTAYLLCNGKIKSLHHKTLLPTYDIFEEYRYFESNKEFICAEINNEKFAITICEDLWDNQPVETSFAKNKLYRTSPMEQLISQNPKFIINIAASPFSTNQQENRFAVLKENALKYKLPIIYVNQVGAQTELIFDGDSQVLNKEGNKVKSLKTFEEDFVIIDTENIDSYLEPEHKSNIENIHNALVLGIKDYFKKIGFSKAVLGLSGGIDSAVTLVLAVEALGKENVRVLLMPSKYSSGHSIFDAKKLAETLEVQFDIVPIQDCVDATGSSLKNVFAGTREDITEENIQARIRGIFLMAISNKFGNILLNTSNKSEAAVGYGTLYGDMNGGLSVLGDLYKTEVYLLANYINRNQEIIPVNSIIKPPSAELRPDQKDSDSLPEYNVLDKILFNYIELKKNLKEICNQGFDETLVKKVIRLVNMNEYKRFQAPPILRVSSKAFGMGRRMPLVAKF